MQKVSYHRMPSLTGCFTNEHVKQKKDSLRTKAPGLLLQPSGLVSFSFHS